MCSICLSVYMLGCVRLNRAPDRQVAEEEGRLAEQMVAAACAQLDAAAAAAAAAAGQGPGLDEPLVEAVLLLLPR